MVALKIMPARPMKGGCPYLQTAEWSFRSFGFDQTW